MLGNTPHPNHTAGTRIARLFSATRTAAVTFSFILAVSTPLALASLPHAASADPAPDDQAASQQDAAAQAESMLLELSGNLNEAGVTLSQIKAQEDATATQLAQTQADLEAASAQVQTATEQLNRTAVAQYRTSTGGVSNLMGVLVSATSLDDLAAGMSYAQRITSQQQDALDGFVSAQSELEAKKAALQTQQAALASLEVRFASQQTTVQTALTAQQEFYDNLSPEVKQAVAEREETQQALAQARSIMAPFAERLSALPPAPALIGLGGSCTTAAAMLMGREAHNEAVEGQTVTLAQAMGQLDTLSAMTLEERMRVPGLPPTRAAHICHGLCILITALELTGFDRLTVSGKTNLDGYLQP